MQNLSPVLYNYQLSYLGPQKISLILIIDNNKVNRCTYLLFQLFYLNVLLIQSGSLHLQTC